MDSEKRRADRYGCTVPVVSKKGTAFADSQTVDISHGGVGFISSKFIPVDTKMAIEIDLTPEGEPVLTFGQVRWVEQLADSARYRVGMIFSDISTGAKSRLDKYFRK